MFERPRPLRPPPPETQRRRLLRWAAAPVRPFGHTLQAIGQIDQRALILIRTRGHSELGDRIVGALGQFGELGSGWAAIGLAGAAARPDWRRRFLAAAVAAPIAVLANYTVKLAIGRERPLIADHPPLARAPSKLSFPSAHSTSSVAGAVVLARVMPGARPALYLVAGAICLGRPYLGMHYPSDVLAGAALGYGIGRLYPLPEGVADGRLPPDASVRSTEEGSEGEGLERRPAVSLAAGGHIT